MFSWDVRIKAATSFCVMPVVRRARARSSSAIATFSRATSAANAGSVMRRCRARASRSVVMSGPFQNCEIRSSMAPFMAGGASI